MADRPIGFSCIFPALPDRDTGSPCSPPYGFVPPLPLRCTTSRDELESTDAEATDTAVAATDHQNEPNSPLTLTIFEENDGGIIKGNDPHDRHYTNGTAVSLTFHPQWAEDLADKLYDQYDLAHHATAAGVFAGQLMFTPDDITVPQFVEDDRPYAGYLFGGAFWQHANARNLDHVRLELGVVGPASQADNTQAWIHRIFDGDKPRGWDNQLHNEPTIQGYYRHKWKFVGDEIGLGALPFETQLVPDVQLALGTVHRYVEAGATFRFGVNLPEGFGPAQLDDLSGTAERLQARLWYVWFCALAGQAVEHNLFLEGNTFKDSHSVKEEPLLGQLKAGVRVYYRRGRWSGQIGYDQTFLTPEFKKQNDGDSYASLILAVTGEF